MPNFIKILQSFLIVTNLQTGGRTKVQNDFSKLFSNRQAPDDPSQFVVSAHLLADGQLELEHTVLGNP